MKNMKTYSYLAKKKKGVDYPGIGNNKVGHNKFQKWNQNRPTRGKQSGGSW